ncbi:hypothetical protein DRB05_08175 [Pseudoalteromonas sp. A757]|nr:hypothetical protein DRB05_08175 [Pseudoalteromonas sp. A757]
MTTKKWTMPIQNSRQAMSRFIIEFENRLGKHINYLAVTQNLLQDLLFLKTYFNYHILFTTSKHLVTKLVEIGFMTALLIIIASKIFF